MNEMRRKLGILGCGKMARAMVARWLESGTLTPDQVMACTSTTASAAEVQHALGISCGIDAQHVIDSADIILLSVKPQLRGTVLAGLTPQPGQLWLSVLAGVTTATLETMLPRTQVVRVMPNTPVRVGQGLLAVAPGLSCPPDRLREARALLGPLGTLVDLAETEIDAFTAVAGSGPAYVFRFMEALTLAGVTAGLDAETAALLARKTVLGAACLADRDERDPALLRAEVTSKGGMTQAALAVLEQNDWGDALVVAVQAAIQRAHELGK